MENNVNLFNDGELELTPLTKGIIVDGKLQDFSVYKIKLDKLHYNNRNGRIFSSVIDYSSNNNIEDLSKEEYNDLFEDFIYNSNKAEMDKTIENIKMYGQAEPGVVLNNGCVIDGNRRFTALRKIQKLKPNEQVYFLAIVLDKNIDSDQKEIKKLEFNLQHAIESRVKYEPINLALEAYDNIVHKELFTIKEYAKEVNEKESLVRQQLTTVTLIKEYLDYFDRPNDFKFLNPKETYSSLSELGKKVDKQSNVYDQQVREVVYEIIKLKPFNDITRFIRKVFKVIDYGQREYLSDVKAIINNQGLDEMSKKEQVVLITESYLNKEKKKSILNKPQETYSTLLSTLDNIESNINERNREEYRVILNKINNRIKDVLNKLD